MTVTVIDRPTRGQVEGYCDNLKRSLLALADAGCQLHLEIESDAEPSGVPSERFGRTATDWLYMGEKRTVSVVATGRPAKILEVGPRVRRPNDEVRDLRG